MTDSQDMTFARRLRQYRGVLKITQRQLASWMTISGYQMHQTTIAKIEAGERPVIIGEAAQFAAILGIPLTELIATDADREQEALLDARLTVGLLRNEAENRRNLYEQAVQQLAEAEKRLRHLEGSDCEDAAAAEVGWHPARTEDA